MCRALLALTALLALPAGAQTQFADSSGGYVALRNLGVAGSHLSGMFGDGLIGYRFSNGTDVGVRIGVPAFGDGLTAGPTAGHTWAGPLGSRLRLEGSALYQSARRDVSGNSVDGFETVSRRELSADVTATVSRPLRLVGSLRVVPTVGVFGVAERQLSFAAPSRYSAPDEVRAAAGVHLELPLSFRLFGATVTTGPVWRYGPLRTGGAQGPGAALFQTYAGGGVRLNF